ncbi:MAG: catalase family protein [Candidatus Nanopelagicales bacterium]
MPATPDFTPSTAWSEIIGPGEAARYARQADRIAAVQNAKNAAYGRGRTLHRKQLLGLTATLDIAGRLPQHAAHGLFARPGRHEALVRMSSGGTDRAPDRVPDIRGFAIKVRGIDGPGALGGTTSVQDFLLINHPAFNMRTSDDFVGLVHASLKGPAGIAWYALRTRGPLGAPGMLASLGATVGRRFTGFGTETFWSAAPLANGPYAIRVRLVPVDPGPPATSKDWAADLAARLADGPLRYDLQLQFYCDESITPIEDPTVDWPSPYVTVGRLDLPQQDPSSEAGERVQAEAEAAAFDPWAALADHRPLGEVMRARKSAYRTSQVGRGIR